LLEFLFTFLGEWMCFFVNPKNRALINMDLNLTSMLQLTS